MKHKISRWVSILLALVLLAGMLPLSASAAESLRYDGGSLNKEYNGEPVVLDLSKILVVYTFTLVTEETPLPETGMYGKYFLGHWYSVSESGELTEVPGKAYRADGTEIAENEYPGDAAKLTGPTDPGSYQFALKMTDDFNDPEPRLVLNFTISGTLPHTHSFGAWQEGENGLHVRTCACGAKEEANHRWNDGVETTPPTHTQAGVRTYTCADCDATYTEPIEKTTEHSFGAWQAGENGLHVRTCACGEKETANHAWGTVKHEKEPTCTQTGLDTYTCTVCDAVREETIPALGHDAANNEWKTSRTAHWKLCVRDNAVVDEGDHEWGEDDTCTVCGMTKPGEVTSDTDKENNAFSGDFARNDAASLENLILTEADQARVDAGESASITLEVADMAETVSEEEKAKIEAASGENTIGLYLDINLFKQIGDDEREKVTQTNGAVTISIVVPEALRPTATTAYTYQIVRIHDGVATLLDGSYAEETGTFTFSTDQFSTYALVYQRTAVQQPTPSPAPAQPGSGEPQTGDSGNVLPWVTLAVVSGLSALALVYARRKRQ